jgi:hypothetical protein
MNKSNYEEATKLISNISDLERLQQQIEEKKPLSRNMYHSINDELIELVDLKIKEFKFKFEGL